MVLNSKPAFVKLSVKRRRILGTCNQNSCSVKTGSFIGRIEKTPRISGEHFVNITDEFI